MTLSHKHRTLEGLVRLNVKIFDQIPDFFCIGPSRPTPLPDPITNNKLPLIHIHIYN